MSNVNNSIPSSMHDRVKLAEYLAHAGGVLGRDLRGNPAAILTAMYAAESLGVGLWPMLTNLQVIDGRPEISANMMRALAINAGHEINVLEHTPKICRLEIERSNGRKYDASFSIEDAEQAGLITRKGYAWKSYALDMLYARATSRLIRRHAPDVLCGDMYVHGEIIGSDDEYTEETDEDVTAIVTACEAATSRQHVTELARDAEDKKVLYAVYLGHSVRTILAQKWAALGPTPTVDTDPEASAETEPATA